MVKKKIQKKNTKKKWVLVIITIIVIGIIISLLILNHSSTETTILATKPSLRTEQEKLEMLELEIFQTKISITFKQLIDDELLEKFHKRVIKD